MAAWWETTFAQPQGEKPWWETAFGLPDEVFDAQRNVNPMTVDIPREEIGKPPVQPVAQNYTDNTRTLDGISREYPGVGFDDLPTVPEGPAITKKAPEEYRPEYFDEYMPRPRSTMELLAQRVPDSIEPETPENLAALSYFNYAKDNGLNPEGLMDWAAGGVSHTAGTARGIGAGAYKAAGDAINALADWNELSTAGFGGTGAGPVDNALKAAARWMDTQGENAAILSRYNQLVAGESRPEHVIGQMLTDGVRAIPDMAMVIATTALTRNPNAGYAVMGAQVAAQSYGQARYMEGKGIASSLADAFASTAAELGPERAFKVLEPVADATMPLMKRLWKTGLAESASEGTTGLLTRLDEEFRQGRATPDSSMDVLTGVLQEAGTGAVAGIGMGGGGAVIHGGAGLMDSFAQSREMDKILRGAALARATDAFNPNQSFPMRYMEQPSGGILPGFDAAFNQAAADIDDAETLFEQEEAQQWGPGTFDTPGIQPESWATENQEVSRGTPDNLFDTLPSDETIGPFLDRALGPDQAATRSEPDADRSFIETHVDPRTVLTDPEAFQYKTEDIDAEGANKTLSAVSEWNPAAAGVVTLWERNDGQRFVVDGHQRLNLAKRLVDQSPRLLARVYREADGFTKEDLRFMAAVTNIAQNTGSIIDAAKIMREVEKAGDIGGITPETLDRVLPKSGAINKHAPGLAKLADEPFMAVVNGLLKPEHAAIIGERYGDPGQQLAAIDALAKAEPETLFQARDILEQMDEAGFQPGQSDMFGETMAQSYFKERAKLVEMVARRAKNKRALYGGLIRNEGQISGVGKNRVDVKTNKQLVEEQDTLLAQIGVLTRSTPEISDVLNAQAQLIGTGKGTIGQGANAVERAIAGYVERGGPRPAGTQGILRSDGVDAKSQIQGLEPARSGSTEAGAQAGAQELEPFGDRARAEQAKKQPAITAAESALRKLQELNPQLKNTLRVEVLSESEMARRPVNTSTGRGSRAGHLGAVVNLTENATLEEVAEEVRHTIDMLLGGSQLSKWIDEDPKMNRLVRDFLNGRKDRAADTRYDDGAEIAQSLLDQYFRNPKEFKAALPDLFEFLEQMGASKYRPAMQEIYDAMGARDGKGDLLGQDTSTEQAKADTGRAKDDKRSGKPGTETVPVEAGAGELFSGPKPPDLFSQPTTPAQDTAAPSVTRSETSVPDQSKTAPNARFIEKREAIYEKGSTQINLPERDASKVVAFGQAIPDSEVFVDPDDATKGREKEPHVTVLYGVSGNDHTSPAKALEGVGPITFTLGETKVFENEKFDVLVAEVKSDSLAAANKALRDSVEYENDFPDYKPHVTIAYLKKGEGKKYAGRKDLSGIKVSASEVQFSAASGELYAIDTGAAKPAQPRTAATSPPSNSSEKAIADFGEVIAGAKKHYAALYRDKMDAAKHEDIAAVGLTQSWPEPDYQQLLDGGTDDWVVGFVRAARDEIPPKPRKTWKLDGWVKQVKGLRDFSDQLLTGEITAERVRDALNQDKWTRLRNGILPRVRLYQAVGHAKSLKGIRVSAGTYSIYKGEKIDPPKTIWTVEQKAKATAFSNWPRILAEGSTQEAAIADFKQKLQGGALDDVGKAERTSTFGIWTNRRQLGTYYIGKKIGKSIARLKEFSDLKEARVYLKDHADELEKLLEKYKVIPDVRRPNNNPRVGADHRNGGDVTPEQFQEAFGFRGVQFGNYVEQSRRQLDLNDAYDALMDLAGVLDFPARSLSLNGELGLAFGARGSGGQDAAAAHYEPVEVVINLTKKRGAGSLAHEWWHALDNYFARQRADSGKKDVYLTETTDRASGEMREEMREAFRKINQAVERTALRARSLRLDERKSKPYWSTGREMTARSFESHIAAKLKDQSAANDYLANIVSEEYWKASTALGMELEGTYPYPDSSEIPAIREAFDNFFQVVETKETAEGGIMLFERSDPAPATKRAEKGRQTILTRQLEVAMARFTGNPVEAGTYTQVESPKRHAASVKAVERVFGRRVAFFRANKPTGFSFNGVVLPNDSKTIYVNAGSQNPFMGVVGHELLHTLRREHPELYDRLADMARARLKTTGFADFAEMLDAKIKDNKGDKRLSDDALFEEMVANVVGDAFLDPAFVADLRQMDQSFLQRLVDAIVEILRSFQRRLTTRGMGSSQYFNDVENLIGQVQSLLLEQARAKPAKAKAARSFSEAPAFGRSAITKNFYEERIDEIWSGKPRRGAALRVLDRSDVLDMMGLSDKPLVVLESKVNKTFDKHNLTNEHWKKIPDWVDNPLAVFKSESEPGVLVFVTPESVGGSPIIVVVEPKPEQLEASLILTAFDKSGRGVLQKWTNDGLLKYIREKGKPLSSGTERLQWPKVIPHLDRGFEDTVLSERDLVKYRRQRESDPKFHRSQGTAGWVPRVKPLTEVLKSRWNYWMRAQGNLPDVVFAEKIKRDNSMGADELHIRHKMADFDRAVRLSYGKPYSKLTAAEKETLNDYLAGQSVTIPAGVKTAMIPMRDYLDRLSDEMITEGVVQNQDTINKILNNIGQYLNRSYQAFDDPEWPRKVPDSVRRAAYQHIEGRMRQEGKLAGLTAAQIEDKVSGQIENILQEGTAADSIGALVSESKLGSKDLSMLIQRKEIPKPIRDLLGEYRDARVNFVRSATKMERAIMNHVFLEGVKANGQGVFLFDEPTGEYSVRIASEASSPMAPLNGLYTTPEIRDAFTDALDKEQMANWWRWTIGINGFVKYGKTVLSVTTISRNFLSASFFGVANGHFALFNPKATKTAFQTIQRELRSVDGSRDYAKKMKRLGVIYDNPYAGEMIGVLKDFTDSESAYIEGAFKGGARKFFDVMTQIYQSGDNLWKVLGFEIEAANLVKHGGMTRQAAEREAAERIRNTYPTYSMVGKAIRWLRRFPLIGTFVSFPAEIVRTSVNIVRYAAKDAKKPGMKVVAAQKVVGIAMAAGLAAAARSISMAIMGFDDDDDEAVRMMGPPWSKNSDLFYVGYDENGLPEYFDLSFLDPYNYLKRPLNALFRGKDDWQDRLKSALTDMTQPFIGTDILAGAIGEVVYNQKETGGPVYNPDESNIEQFKAIFNHLRKAVQPGTFGNIERITDAVQGDVSRYGKQYKLADEVWAVGGFRKSTLNPLQSISFKAFEFAERSRNATQILSYPLGGQNEVSEKEIESAFGRMIEARAEAFQDMIDYVSAAESMNLPRSSIKPVLKASGVSQANITAIMRGRIPAWEPSSQFLDSAKDRAMETAESMARKLELRKTFDERVRLVKKLAREEARRAWTNQSTPE